MPSGEAIKVFPYGWKQTNILLHSIFISQLRKERERERGGGREEGRKKKKERKRYKTLYQSARVAIAEYHRLGGLNNKNLFFTVLEARRS